MADALTQKAKLDILKWYIGFFFSRKHITKTQRTDKEASV